MNNRLSSQRRVWMLQKAKEQELKEALEREYDERENSRRSESEVCRTNAGSGSKHRNIFN